MPEASRTDIRPLLPLSLVAVMAIGGDSLMVVLFVSVLRYDHGVLPAAASVSQRTIAGRHVDPNSRPPPIGSRARAPIGPLLPLPWPIGPG